MPDSQPLRIAFNLPPEQAVAYFRQKGYRIGFDHRDVWQQQHQAGFTVAKAMQLDLLMDIRQQVDIAIELGGPRRVPGQFDARPGQARLVGQATDDRSGHG